MNSSRIRYIIFFILIVYQSFTLYGNDSTVKIEGTIQNFKNRKIQLEIRRTDKLCFHDLYIKKKIKTDKKGNFKIELDFVEHPLFFNTLKIGKKSFDLLLQPNDSIILKYDYSKNLDSLEFSGTDAGLRHFYRKLIIDFNKKITLGNNWLEIWTTRLDGVPLIKDCDPETTELIRQFTYLSYYDSYLLNYLQTNFSSLDAGLKYLKSIELELLGKFEENTNRLSWYFLYYSALNGYLLLSDEWNDNLSTAEGLLNRLDKIDANFSGSLKEKFKAYTIGFALITKSKEIRKSENVKRVLRDFVKSCSNQNLKLNMKEALIANKILE